MSNRFSRAVFRLGLNLKGNRFARAVFILGLILNEVRYVNAPYSQLFIKQQPDRVGAYFSVLLSGLTTPINLILLVMVAWLTYCIHRNWKLGFPG